MQPPLHTFIDYVRDGEIQGQWFNKNQRVALYFTMSDIVHRFAYPQGANARQWTAITTSDLTALNIALRVRNLFQACLFLCLFIFACFYAVSNIWLDTTYLDTTGYLILKRQK